MKKLLGNTFMIRILLNCGILSSLLYVAMNIFIPMLYEGYNSASQTVSELSAIGAPTRSLWIWLGTIYTMLVIAFGWGVSKSAIDNRRLHVVGILIFCYGVISVIWPFTPMHQRVTLASGGKTMTDTMHLLMATVTVLFMLLAMIFGINAFGKRFRIYSILTIIILLLFGALTALDAPNVQANLPTPFAGVWERINIGIFLLWIIELAIILLKEVSKPMKSSS